MHKQGYLTEPTPGSPRVQVDALFKSLAETGSRKASAVWELGYGLTTDILSTWRFY